MHRGYVKFWRKTKDSGLSCVLLGLWAHCLLEAAHSGCTIYCAGQAVELSPGQFIFGRGAWAPRLGLSEKVLRNLIGTLQKRAMIRASKRASTYSVFEIINWDTYQDETRDEGQHLGQQKGQPRGQQRASSGPHSKNEENEENKKKAFFVEGAPPLRLATYLFNCIRLNRPEFKTPDLQTWGLHVDLMLRIDKRDPDHIREVIKWAQEDNVPQDGTGFCWAANILSTQKLRKQFDQLAIKMNAANTPRGAPRQPRATTVHQQKQVEGEQKALMLQALRKSREGANGQGIGTGMAGEGRPALSPLEAFSSGAGGEGRAVDGRTVGDSAGGVHAGHAPLVQTERVFPNSVPDS